MLEVFPTVSRLLGLFVLFALTGLIAACAAPSSGPRAEPAPTVTKYSGGSRLAVDSRVIDYGNVSFNQEVKATFKVTNVGDQKLAIRKVDVKIVQGC
jgi:hypothetical protein